MTLTPRSHDMLVYTARHVLPVAAPPIADGAVATEEGKVVAVGPRADVIAAHPDTERRDLADAVLMPGLVNAHTHAELSWMSADPPPPGDYIGWLRGLLQRRDAAADEQQRWQAAEQAVAAMESRGTVGVGDVANEIWMASVLARSSLHGVVFHELYGFAAGDAEKLLTEAAARLGSIAEDEDFVAAAGRLSVVLTPHGAHTTSSSLVKALAGRAVAARAPLSVHVGESEQEVRFLQDGSGPFRDLLTERGLWEEAWRAPKHTPVEQLDRLGALTPRTSAVHCVHVTHQDLSMLQARGCSVITCPRSNRRLDVGQAPVPRMLASGIPVALGTDSLASAPDLDLFAEMSALREEHPGLAPAAVLRMATLNGARALGLEELGAIAPGKLDRLIVVGPIAPGDDPLELVTTTPAEVLPLERARWEGVAT